MRFTPRLLSLLALSSLLLAACGDTSVARDALTGKTPYQVLAAAAPSASTPYRFTMTGSLLANTEHVKNVTAATLRSFGPLATGFEFKGSGAAENSKRMSVTLTLTGSTTPIINVTYDDTVYISNDGGKHFALASGSGSSSSPPIGSSPTEIFTLLSSLPAARDQGTKNDKGVALEQYISPVNQAVIAAVLQRGTTSGEQTPSAAQDALASLISVQSGDVEVAVRHDNGYIDNASVAADFSFDVGGMYRALAGGATDANSPSGDVIFVYHNVAKFSDYGTPITITKPKG